MKNCLNYDSYHWGISDLTKQVQNVKDCYRGKFVLIDGKEHLIPFAKKGVPNVEEDILLIKYGNTNPKEEILPGFYDCAAKAIEKEIGLPVDKAKIKPITYITEDQNLKIAGRLGGAKHDNTVRHQAFGYYDENNKISCLYFSDNKTVVTNKSK